MGVVALNPDSHEVLTQADIPDTVLHLILPADEMFYTNQTTKFARYVKHLGARILVYMGLLTKVSNKVNLFDILGKLNLYYEDKILSIIILTKTDYIDPCRLKEMKEMLLYFLISFMLTRISKNSMWKKNIMFWSCAHKSKKKEKEE